MRCEEFLHRFDLFADAAAGMLALEPDELDALRLHARECAACRAEGERARELAAAIKALPEVEWLGSILQAPPRGRAGVARRVAVAAALAAMATAGAFLLYSRGKDRSLETPPAGLEPAALKILPAGAAPEARRVVEAVARDPAARQTALERLRGDPELSLSFVALGRAARAEFDGGHSRGDLDSMLAAARLTEMLDSLLLGAGNPVAFASQDYERVFLTNGFWLGYTCFALGDLEAARAALRDYIARIDALESERGPLDKVVEIYRDFRAKDVLEFLETRAGKPAPVELELGESWITRQRLRLADCRGQVVALIFRRVADERAGRFLAPLAEFCAGRGEVRIGTVSWFEQDTQSTADQIARLREDLEGLGYEGPAGFDPDAEGKGIFRAFHAAVGSATFFILNKRGELVWYMPDPRGIDVRFATALLLRLAAE